MCPKIYWLTVTKKISTECIFRLLNPQQISQICDHELNKLNQISISDLRTLPIFKLDFPIDIYSKFRYPAEPQPKSTNKRLINLQFIKLADPDGTSSPPLRHPKEVIN